MFTVGFGEVLTDIMTISPLLSGIPSASNILDVSNYTFNSISYGKDAHGFKFHAHVISSIYAADPISNYNDNFLQFIRYNSVSPSSYHSSATHLFFSSFYSSIPNYPSVYDRRLERLPTVTHIPNLSDVGHYINIAVDPGYSSLWNVVGGFPPSGDVGKFRLLNSAGSAIYSGTLSGVYNSYGIADKNGFIKINENNASASITDIIQLGPKIFIETTTFSANPILQLLIVPQMGDAAALAAFGGVNHIGVWALDIKTMLSEGLNPPYVWNNINNIRKYKLVAKVTYWRDLLNHDDLILAPVVAEFPGYLSFMVNGINSIGTAGPGFVLKFKFN